METDYRFLAIDCSKATHLDAFAIYLLLQCLQEAMKRNGDVRLFGVPDEGKAMLNAEGVDRLFGIYESRSDAVNSYQQPSVSAVRKEEADDRMSLAS